MALDLSPRQSRTIAAAVTTLAALVIVITVGLLGWLAAAFLRTFSGVFLPLAVGAVAALVFRPYYDWLRMHARLPVPVAVAAVLLTLLVPLVGFLWFFGQVLVSQLLELSSRAPVLWAQARDWVSAQWPQAAEILERSGTTERIRRAVVDQQDTLVQGLQMLGDRAFAAGRGVARALGGLFGWVVLPVYFAFFLTVRGVPLDRAEALPFLKAETRDDVVQLFHEFVQIMVAFFRGQLLVAFLQGLLFAIGFSLVGLRYGFVIGLLLGVLNVIPYLGSMLGLAVAVPLSLLQPGGGPLTCVLVLAVFTLVQTIEGWYLTPKIMGDRTGLHFMTIIVAIFFWGVALDGILGMILAIPLTAFLASLWRLARAKYIPEIL